jgi:hypothetical protein
VSVDLSLGSPSAHVASDMTSILYVACSRVNELKNLFVSAIHPAIWKQLGNSESDNLRRLHEEELKKSSAQFARRSSQQISANQLDFLKEYEWEHADETTPGMSDALEQEWDDLRTLTSPPKDVDMALDSSATCSPREHPHSPSWMKPVRYDILNKSLLFSELHFSLQINVILFFFFFVSCHIRKCMAVHYN